MIDAATSQPRVTVIIPAYNAERFIDLTLASLVAQTFPDWEAIIIDDGSTDGTAVLVEAWQQRDARLRLVRQANAGVSTARNVGLEQARGAWIAMLDSDDLWDPRKLELQMAAQEASGADVLFCGFHACDDQGQPLPLPPVVAGEWSGAEFFLAHYGSFFVYPSTAFLSTEALRRVGGFDTALRACEDWDLWLRMAQEGNRFLGMPDRLMTYRKHPNGLSVQADFGAILRVFQRHAQSSLLGPRVFRHGPVRSNFRNCFTYLGSLGRIDEAAEMFDLYRPFDQDGIACRVMWLLRHTLPIRAFWFLCRFAVIPLAWKIEIFGERWRAKTGSGETPLAT